MAEIDWTASMQQTYEFYKVNPETWEDTEKIDKVTGCEIKRDSDSETLGSATLDVTEALDECYVRTYLIARQNGFKHKEPLGTFLVQTPSTSYNGLTNDISTDAYTPLLELKESMPPFGYSIAAKQNIMETAYNIISEQARAPVVEPKSSTTLTDDFVANTDDTWLTFLTDLIANADFVFDVNPLGQILFAPVQDTASLTPIWTYDDGNSSILYPEISMERDLYGIPNVVEVVYSSGTSFYYGKATNSDPDSPISTVSRGREIVNRITDPDLSGVPSQAVIDQYAKQTLRNLSCLEYTISYTHGYCPVRVGDCVRLNYERAGIINVKAKVISQTIKCEPGCAVTEKAVFSTNLWG